MDSHSLFSTTEAIYSVKKSVALSALLFLASPVSVMAGILPFHGFALGAGVGTEGIGLQGTTAILPGTLNLNVGFSTLSLSTGTLHTRGGDYRARVRLQGEPVTLSWFPFHGNFSLTLMILMMNAGAIYEGAANVSLAATGAAASPQLASSLQQARQSPRVRQLISQLIDIANSYFKTLHYNSASC